MIPEKIEALVTEIEERIGRDFDGECHLTEEMARACISALRELLADNERLEGEVIAAESVMEIERGAAAKAEAQLSSAEAKLAKAKAVVEDLVAATILANDRVVGIKRHHVDAARSTLSEIEDR